MEDCIDYRGLENTCYIKFRDDKYEEIEKLLAEGEKITLSHQWQDGEETPKKEFYIRKFRSEYVERGCIIEIWGAEKSYAFEMNDKFRTFVDKTISDIFKEVMQDYYASGDIIVEDTKGTHTLIQRNISDDRFVREVLLPLAISGKGSDKRDYWFYGVEGKEVHFHSPDSELKVYKTYSAHHDADHPLKSFKTLQNDVDHCKGSAKLTVTGYDPLRKIPIKHEISKEDAGGDQLKFGAKATDYKEEDGRYYRTPYPLEEQIEGIAKNMWYRSSYHDHKAVAVLRADPMLTPGRVIDIDMVVHDKGDLLEKSGFYFVDKCTFIVSSRKYDAICELSKNSHVFGHESAQGEEVNPSAEKSEKTTKTTTYESTDDTVKKPIKSV